MMHIKKKNKKINRYEYCNLNNHKRCLETAYLCISELLLQKEY